MLWHLAYSPNNKINLRYSTDAHRGNRTRVAYRHTSHQSRASVTEPQKPSCKMAGYPSAALGTQVRQTSVILFHQYPVADRGSADLPCEISPDHSLSKRGFLPIQAPIQRWRRVWVSIPNEAHHPSAFRVQPVCQFRQLSMDEGKGFEPLDGSSPPSAFKADSIDRSDSPP